MALSRALRRLLRIRDIEEEQSRIALEAAIGDRRRLEQAQIAATERDRRGRGLVDASTQTGELTDRLVDSFDDEPGSMIKRVECPCDH